MSIGMEVFGLLAFFITIMILNENVIDHIQLNALQIRCKNFIFLKLVLSSTTSKLDPISIKCIFFLNTIPKKVKQTNFGN